jgi:scyllo-inosamine 4-kinase
VLIHGAAVLDQLRDLDIWHDHDTIKDSRPARLLTSLLEVDGGYLAPLLGPHH